MDEYDDHLTPEMIFAVREGRLRRDELLCFAVEHLRHSCPECSQALQKVAAELGLLSPSWLRQVAWKSLESNLETCLPSIQDQERQTLRELATLRGLSTWPERIGRVKRARSWFRSPSTVYALIEESKRWLVKDVDEAIEWAHLGWEVAYRVGETGHPAFPIVWARAIAHEANATRVADRLEEAGKLFAVCQRFVRERIEGEPYTFAEIDALHASLLRDQGSYPQATKLLFRSIGVYEGLKEWELAGRTLTILANTYTESGDDRLAISYARQAVTLLRESRSVYLQVCAEHTLCMALTDDDQFRESERLYRQYQHLYGKISDRRIHAAHCWLQGRLALGRNRWQKAVGHFVTGRRRFLDIRRSYEATRIGLEWALCLFKARDFARSEEVALQMVVEFRKLEAANREATAALVLFARAAKARKLTLELVRAVSRFLAQSQRRPNELVFRYESGGEE